MKGKQKEYYEIIKGVVDKIEGNAYGKDDEIDEGALIDDLIMITEDM